MSNKFKIKLTTLTPVSIGDGGRRSPLTDYIFGGNNIQYINQEAFSKQLLSKGVEVIDRYMNEVAEVIGSNRNDFLRGFLEKETIEDTSTFITQKPVACYGIKNACDILTIVKNYGAPYVPGSSLKGAIKTAILYHWMMTNGHSEVEKVKSNIEKGRYFLKRIIEDDIENKVFGNIRKRGRMDFSLFRITDTTTINQDGFCIYNTHRLHLDSVTDSEPKGQMAAAFQGINLVSDTKDDQGQNEIIEVAKEAIKPETVLFFDIDMIKNNVEHISFANNYLKGMLYNNPLRNLFSVINEFSLDHITFELATIQSIKEKSIRQILKPYEAFLNSKREFILKTIQGGNEKAIMVVGSGKTYFLNSLGLALFNHWKSNDLRAWKKFRSVFSIGKFNTKHFPITRALTSQKNIPMGWVLLEQS